MAGLNTKVQLINAEEATKILKKNNQNRPISDTIVNRYSTLMKDKKWHFNGEPIIIAADGTLVDGQHRLHAIIKSGEKLEMLVVRGVARTAFSTIDIGRKRTGADALATFGEEYSKNRNVIAAAVNNVLAFTSDGIWDDNSRKRPTHDELINFVSKNRKIISSVEYTAQLGGAKKLAPHSCLAALHYLFSKKDLDQCNRFFQQFDSGEGLNKNHPVLLLRSRLIDVRHYGGVFRTREVVPFIVKAWELVRDGKEVERLVVGNDYVPKIK